MKHPTFRHFKRGERLSAQEYNRVVRTVASNAGSLHIQGYADSTGFHTRRFPSVAEAAVVVRSARIQTGGVPSNNTGPFTCKLLDSAGDEVGDDIDVYPREHLGTNDFDGDVRPAFIATDYMSIFKALDGKWYTTFVFEDVVFNSRGCRIQTGGVPANAVGPFVCKLLDSAGDETGADIDVWPQEHLGTSNFNSGDVHPSFAASDYMSICKDLDGKWYTTFIFEDTIDCVCTAP